MRHLKLKISSGFTLGDKQAFVLNRVSLLLVSGRRIKLNDYY